MSSITESKEKPFVETDSKPEHEGFIEDQNSEGAAAPKVNKHDSASDKSNKGSEKQSTEAEEKKKKSKPEKQKEPVKQKEYKGLCIATFHYLSSHESARTFLNQHLPTTNVKFIEGNGTEGGKQYRDYKEAFEATLDLSDGCSLQTLETILSKTWSSWASQNEPYGWFEIRPKDQRLYRIQNQLASEMTIDNIQVIGGAITSPTTFVQHWDIRHSLHPVVTFEHDKKLLTIATDPVLFGASHLVLEIPYNSINDSVIVSSEENTYRFYIGTIQRPKLYIKRKISEQKIEERRITSFDNVSRQNFGMSSAICISINDKPSSQSNGNSVWDVISRLKRSGFSVEYADVEHSPEVSNPRIKKAVFDDFEIEYAWRSLLSHGFKVTDVIDDDDLNLFDSTANCITSGVFFEMANGVEDKLFFDFKTHYHNYMTKVDKHSKVDEKEDLPQHFALVRRMVITPTTELFLQKEPIVQNRILRQYDNDFFIRIVMRDEDFERLSATLPENLNQIIDRFKDILRHGFDVGNRHYDFLACSNSQLREHGVWFFASYNGITTHTIRSNLGNLSNEECVASYVSRLALCFSSSRDTLDVAVDEGSVGYIDDVERGNFCFTDGIGQISVPLAHRVAATLEMECTPSAFQIRYAGCKGVVSQDPTLGSKDIVTIRESMRKFESPSKRLEILQVTHPGRLFMNRQVITLMSGLGVPDHEFLSLQEAMLLDMADMMLYEDKAMQSLSSVALGIKYKQLQKAGIIFTQEPFFRSILLTLYKSKLSELLSRSRIEIPYESGRSMMGTVDETGILGYGEVFISYSKDPHLQQKNIIVHTGEVVVTKNPCFHPGDLRKFTAVNVPQLSHMVDCIVFPTKGSRPHPNEMSGSDLDGDMYFVCWDQNLIPPVPNEDPMVFPKAMKSKLYRAVEVEDIINYIGDYIKLDQLGIIANAHVVHADLKNIYSSECLQLAEMHSEAVDFPKTGKAPTMQRDLRVEKYPDFMSKSDKPSYTSAKILGKLFRQCKSLEQAQRRYFRRNLVVPKVVVDSDLKYLGYESFMDEAIVSRDVYNEKVLQLMSLYGIENESEIASGVIQKVRRKRGSLKNEKYEIGQIVRAKMSVIRERTRSDFFREFNGYETAMSTEELRPSVRAKASAWYIATYEKAIQDHDGVALLSFPWIISDILAELKSSSSPSELTKEEQNVLEIQRNMTTLHQIGASLIRHYDQTKEERGTSFTRLLDLANYAASQMKMVTGATIDIYMVGINPAGLLGINENIIEFYVSSKGRQYSFRDFEILFSHLPDFKIIGRGSKLVVEVKNANVYVCITQSYGDLHRSRYILDFVNQNYKVLPVIQFLLDWFKSTGIVGKFQNHIFDESTFVVMAMEVLGATEKDRKMNLRFSRRNVSEIPLLPKLDLDYPVSENIFDHKVTCWIADCTLRFLRHFNAFVASKMKGNKNIELCDPSSVSGKGKITVGIDARGIKKITDEMLNAYQEIAQTKSVDTFFGESVLQDGHLVQTLPLDVWGSIMFAEAYSARRLSELTGAEVHIRRTQFREVAGLILEAWGTNDQLWKVMQSLHELSDKSAHVVNTLARDKAFINGAFHCVFEGCSNETDVIRLLPYGGPNQPDHDNKVLKIPTLRTDQQTTEDISGDLEIFKRVFVQQIDLIRRDYDPTYHGDIRLGLAFGTYYVTNVEVSEMTVLEFTDRMNKKPSDNRLYLGRGRGRGRGRRFQRSSYSSILPSRQMMMRSSFMPIEFEQQKILSFLVNNHFVSDKEEEKYHVSIKFGSPDFGKQHTGSVILDEELSFLELRLSDIKWMAIDLVRKTHRDVRCKIQSRRMVHIDAVKEMDDIKSLLDSKTKLLIKFGQRDLYASPNFREKVTFVRKKRITTYHYCGPVVDNNIWQDMKIEVTDVTEYSRPETVTGRFGSVESRNEVTVYPRFTGLENEEEWTPFAEDVWRFATQLGKILE